jgi:hypothetical protein
MMDGLKPVPSQMHHYSANYELKWLRMAFPVKTCVVCGEEFELKPDKPGFANRCPECSQTEESDSNSNFKSTGNAELNAARRNAMRDMLYRKDS